MRCFSRGTCLFTAIRGSVGWRPWGTPKGISGIPEDKLYYTLAPLYSAGLIYAPLDTPVLMRPVLTREAAEKLIAQIPSIREDDCGSRDPKFLSEHYRGFF